MPTRQDRPEYWRLMKRDLFAFAANSVITVLGVVLGIVLKSDGVIHAAELVSPTFLLYSAYRALRYGMMPAGYGSVWYGTQARVVGGFFIAVYAIVVFQLWGFTTK